jgi:hypothetical protein
MQKDCIDVCAWAFNQPLFELGTLPGTFFFFVIKGLATVESNSFIALCTQVWLVA